MFKDKTLLITGGTGSFGNAVLRRFLSSDLAEIRIFSRDEKKQDDMRKRYRHPKLKFYLGDVRDYRSVQAAMRGVDFVFPANSIRWKRCGRTFSAPRTCWKRPLRLESSE
jgi:UDP-N-acetylglucosamine 4,6-dehydratase